MFNLREFVKQGFSDAVDIGDTPLLRLTAAGWHDKGVLTEGDLAEISAAIDAKNCAYVAEQEGEA